jgi:hypothetical protein
MGGFTRSELQNALNKYKNGKYGKIDKAFFQQIGSGIRERRFLTSIDLFCVLCWKMWAYEKALDLAFESIIINSEDKITQVTRKGIELADQEKISEAVAVLTEYPTKLYGVAVRTASAILTFYDPKRYAVVDVRSWKALYDEELTEEAQTPQNYEKYLKDVRMMALQFEMTAHDIDAALWVIGGGKT